jgi:hypothetical protein
LHCRTKRLVETKEAFVVYWWKVTDNKVWAHYESPISTSIFVTGSDAFNNFFAEIGDRAVEALETGDTIIILAPG